MKSGKNKICVLQTGKKYIAGFFYKKIIIALALFLLFAVYYPLFTADCFADEIHTVIISDRLEYFHETGKYVASGSVVIDRDGALIQSDEVVYFGETSEIVAAGNVGYNDNKTVIKARKAELNMEAKTGKLFDAEIFFKKDNYHLSGAEIEKRGEDYYHSPGAKFTTCDSPMPAWCFKGKEINAVLGKRLDVRAVTFRIKDLPVLYTPYLWVSLSAERDTGFLMPAFSSSKSLGTGLSIPFFWAISENSDATVVVDAYSRRGIGAGLEYRFIEPGGIMGNWWTYHIKDSESDKDFWEVKALYENRQRERVKGFLDINYVNESDYYREFGIHRSVRTLRFLESTGEISAPFSNSRGYLLSQFRVDLKNDTVDAPQKLPEIGYVLDFMKAGSFIFSSSLDAANIWRENGASAKRLDIYPKIFHSLGKDFVVSHMLAVRETIYSFYGDPDMDDNVQKGAIQYDIAGHTRLFRDYSSFMHIIEPSVRYHFVSPSENRLPVFDSSELFGKTSIMEISVLNRGLSKGRELVSLRVTQAFDANNGDRPFLPLKFEAGIRYPLPLAVEAAYDVNSGTIETFNSDLGVRVLHTDIAVGQRYNRKEDIISYAISAAFSPARSLNIAGSLWYDAKGSGLRDLSVTLKYLRQCWGMRVEAVKRPADFTIKVLFELKGLNSRPSKKDIPELSETYF